MLRNLFLLVLHFTSLLTKPIVITTYTLHCEDKNDSFSDDDIDLTVAINGIDGAYSSSTPQIGFSSGQSSKIKGTFVCQDDAYAQFSLKEDDMFKDDHSSFRIKCSNFPTTFDDEAFLHFHFDVEQLSIPITYGLLKTKIGINYEGGAYVLYLNIKGADVIIGDYIYQHSAIELNRKLMGTPYEDQGLYLKNEYLIRNTLQSNSSYVKDSKSTYTDPYDNNDPTSFFGKTISNKTTTNKNQTSNATIKITYEAVYNTFETQYFRMLDQGFEVEASMKLIFNWTITIFFFLYQFF